MYTTTTTASELSGFISSLIDGSGKSRKEIATQAGLGKANMISMLKKGGTKLPLARIKNFAKAVNTDPVQLAHMCLREYHPDVWEVITSLLEPVMTLDEIRMIKAFRAAVGGPFIMALRKEERDRLDEFLKLIAESKTVH